jgi:thiosulfate/3-mercaptopyruvate sulfurtransferase
VRFVDCRSRDAYLAGHVPGAAHADPELDLTGSVGGGRHPLPTEDAFTTWASAAGIGAGTLVVGYDDGTGWAARLWWLLRHFGHDDAAVLRLDAWHGPLRTGEGRSSRRRSHHGLATTTRPTRTSSCAASTTTG